MSTAPESATPRRWIRAALGRAAPHARPLVCTAVLALLSGLFLYPFLWMALSAFKTNAEVFRPLQLFPAEFDTGHYRRLLAGEWFPFWRVFGNSLGVALCQAAGSVALAAMAGYVFAKHRFRGRALGFLLAVAVVVVPRQALVVPLFEWLGVLGLVGSLAGVILPGLVSGLGVIFFTQVFRQVPDELLDMARLEGASELRVFASLLPLVASPLAAFGLVQFILAWHEHLVPLVVLSAGEQTTLPVALASLYGSSLRFPYAVLMAASTLTVIPTALLFACLYRRFKTSLSELMVH